MDTTQFLAYLAADYGRLRDAVAVSSPDTPVPSCPGWVMSDLAWHVAEVYMHKTAAMRLGTWPSGWPPERPTGQFAAVLDRAYRELTAEFAARPADSPARTWYEPDQTVGFWIRRMAQETVIHRIDGELTAGMPVTPIPDDLAVDGIDEVLKVILAYGSQLWPDELAAMAGGHLAAEGSYEVITVLAGGAAWTVRPARGEITARDGASEDAIATVSAQPDPMLRWLWSRGGDSEVQVTGDPAWVDYLSRLLRALTV